MCGSNREKMASSRSKFLSLFGNAKSAVIGMVHVQALPGGKAYIIERCMKTIAEARWSMAKILHVHVWYVAYT